MPCQMLWLVSLNQTSVQQHHPSVHLAFSNAARVQNAVVYHRMISSSLLLCVTASLYLIDSFVPILDILVLMPGATGRRFPTYQSLPGQIYSSVLYKFAAKDRSDQQSVYLFSLVPNRIPTPFSGFCTIAPVSSGYLWLSYQWRRLRRNRLLTC